jgi:hypothetical protein
MRASSPLRNGLERAARTSRGAARKRYIVTTRPITTRIGITGTGIPLIESQRKTTGRTTKVKKSSATRGIR